MNFKTRIKVNCMVSIICALLGIIGILIGIFHNNESDVFIIEGLILFIIGLFRTINYILALTNKAKMQKLEIEHKDERVLIIAYKSGYFTFILSVIGMYIYSLYLLLIGSLLSESISYLCSFLLCLYFICYFIIKKIN